MTAVTPMASAQISMRYRHAPAAACSVPGAPAVVPCEPSARCAGKPVAVTMSWRADSLVLTIVNPAAGRYTPGSGLDGLTERLREAGGTLSHEAADGQFRLLARLPLT
ncbi:MAG TPA: hypothetical protein VGG16_01725, partial [Streptosporangiaceae bacterium]